MDVVASDSTRIGGVAPSDPPGVTTHWVPHRPSFASRWLERLVRLKDRIRGRSRPETAEEPTETAEEPTETAEEPTAPASTTDLAASGGSPGPARRAVLALAEYADQWAWSMDAVRYAEQVLATTPFDAVVSSGPPHMIHLAAASLGASKRAFTVHDFRDPWSLVERIDDRIDSPVWYALARLFEPRIVRDADLIVMNTPPAAERMRQRYRHAEVIAVMNGFQGSFFPSPPSETFRIAYAGDIYLDRDPSPLFRGAKIAIDRLGLSPEQFRIEFMGRVHTFGDTSLETLADQAGVAPYVHLLPRGTREEALDFLGRAHLLISLPQDSTLAIPSKIFDYMRYSAWILAFAEADSATGMVLDGLPADRVSASRVDEIGAVIENRVVELRESGSPPPIGRLVPEYSREAQTAVLLDRLEA